MRQFFGQRLTMSLYDTHMFSLTFYISVICLGLSSVYMSLVAFPWKWGLFAVAYWM